METILEYKFIARKKRGETTEKEDEKYSFLSDRELISLISDDNSQIRTSSAKILGKRQCVQAIPALCDQFKKEEALYSKIAISGALGNLGKPALPELIKLIGKIASNQHDKLPTDIFKKWNYPCPRDIVIRTIVKMGKTAIEDLQITLKYCDVAIASEIIDAIGHISFYSDDQSSFSILKEALTKNKDNQVVIWKILRAFGAFPLKQSIDLLERFTSNSEIPALRWEAARSLGQIKNERCRKILENIVYTEKHLLVSKMAKLALLKMSENKKSITSRSS